MQKATKIVVKMTKMFVYSCWWRRVWPPKSHLDRERHKQMKSVESAAWYKCRLELVRNHTLTSNKTRSSLLSLSTLQIYFFEIISISFLVCWRNYTLVGCIQWVRAGVHVNPQTWFEQSLYTEAGEALKHQAAQRHVSYPQRHQNESVLHTQSFFSPNMFHTIKPRLAWISLIYNTTCKYTSPSYNISNIQTQ